jgi:hypothetical protein
MQLQTALRTFTDYRDALQFVLNTAAHVVDREAVAFAEEAVAALGHERERLVSGSTEVDLAFWVGHEYFTLLPLCEVAAREESLAEWLGICADALGNLALLRAVRAAAIDMSAQ